MVKGASIKFASYAESVPKLLNFLKVNSELKKYDKIILKPAIKNEQAFTPIGFVEAVLKYCVDNKNPIAEISIAEGADGFDTTELFQSTGYKALGEKYSIGLIDLNEAEVEEVSNTDFLKFETIKYPKILLESCVISLPVLNEDEETEVSDSLTNMLGAFPSKYYAGFFSTKKNKIKKWPVKYSIHDILKCKMPNFSIIDASSKGQLLAGLPLAVEKQALKLLGKDWRSISHLKLVSETLSNPVIVKEMQDNA